VEGNHARTDLEMIDTVRHDIIAKIPERFRVRHTAGEIRLRTLRVRLRRCSASRAVTR